MDSDKNMQRGETIKAAETTATMTEEAKDAAVSSAATAEMTETTSSAENVHNAQAVAPETNHRRVSPAPKIVRKIQNMPVWRYHTVMSIALIWLVFQLGVKLIGPFNQWAQYPLHLCFALIMVFLLNPTAERKGERIWWMYDILLIGSVLIVLWYFLSNADELAARGGNAVLINDTDGFVTILMAAVLLEAVRRVVSNSLFVILIIFMGYAWFGVYIPGKLHHVGLSFSAFCEAVMFDRNGVFGAPLKASLNTLFYFLIFGKFFASCGGGAVLMDIGLKLSSKLTGGPAKAAVICSGLMGMVSGSAVANVSGTGVYTIPMMKKSGYTPEEAGSFESLASTGGQLMPPIMGASAFIMAEILGVRYIKIAEMAVLPALAYFTAAFIVAHLVSAKRHIGRHSDLYVDSKPVLPRLYRLAPVAVLVVLLVKGFSFSGAAVICTLLSVFISLVSKETRMSLEGYSAILLDGVRHSANIAVPTAACGLMCGVAVRTELAYRILSIFQDSSELRVLLIVAAICLLLGMALPTIASYLIAYTLFMPAIRVFGITETVANMFLFYFGVVAQITPPVCPASYTAARIADANAWKTGWKAYSYAAVTFTVPFMFIQRPALLLHGNASEIIIAIALLLIAMYWLAGGITGYLLREMNAIERLLFMAAAVLLVVPLKNASLMPCIIGLSIGAAMTLYCLLRRFLAK